jgi:hypothetical protein
MDKGDIIMFYLKLVKRWYYFVIIFIVFIFPNVAGAVSVFPGAKGFGTDTRAAYGNSQNPSICIVDDTTTNNGTLANGTRNGIPVKLGSFRECINWRKNNKVILFEVSGTIGGSSDTRYWIKDDYLTIAGQTAPSPGVILKNAQFIVNGHDVVVQHLRFYGSADIDNDPINIGTSASYGSVYNVVLDHCTVLWGLDETLLVHDYESGTTSYITIANSIIGEGIDTGSNPPRSEESHGFLINGTDYISVIGNLIINNTYRNPWFQGSDNFVLVNSLIYGNDFTSRISSPTFPTNGSFVGNVTKGGPHSNTKGKNYISILWGTDDIYDSGRGSSIYLYDNKSDLGAQTGSSDWSYVYDAANFKTHAKALSAPVWPTGLAAAASSTVQASVLANVGARPGDRDSEETRLIGYVTTNGGRILKNSPTVPILSNNTRWDRYQRFRQIPTEMMTVTGILIWKNGFIHWQQR